MRATTALAFTLTLFTAAFLLAGCGGGPPVLHIYNWADYIDEGLLREFEQAHACRVVMDTFDSNEAMYAKLKAGATGYDLIFPSSYMVNIMHEQGMLQSIQPALVPNLEHIDRSYLKFTMDPTMEHSVPYMIGNSGVGYLDSRVTLIEPTWAMLGRDDLAGRITLLDDMRETLGAALKYLGYSLNSTNEAEIAEAADTVIGWKEHIAKFDSDQYKNGLASAEFLVVHGYSGDVLQAMEENEDVGYVVPEEGTSIASDDMVIPGDATNVELAHAFINFIHTPEIAARNMEYVWYLCPNKAAYELLDDEMREDPAMFLPDEVIARSEAILDLGERNALYSKAWDRVKAAR